MILAALCLLAPGAASAKPREWHVQGTFQTQIQPPESCPPPSTLCSSGIVTGDLEGTVAVVIESSEVVFEAGVPYSRYSGTISVATRRGDLSGRVNGQVRLTDGQLNSVVSFTSGTRGFHSTTGELTVGGTINLATGAEYDTFEGVLNRD